MNSKGQCYFVTWEESGDGWVSGGRGEGWVVVINLDRSHDQHGRHANICQFFKTSPALDHRADYLETWYVALQTLVLQNL